MCTLYINTKIFLHNLKKQYRSWLFRLGCIFHPSWHYLNHSSICTTGKILIVGNVLEDYFNKYDIIFDCTTDNELANIFDKLDTNTDIFNISLTNHAKNLVCIVKPNIYNWLCEVFRILEDDKADLYNPTGCWSPTFKASYNDISTLVQLAIKKINYDYVKEKPLRSFYLSVCENDSINIKTTLL